MRASRTDAVDAFRYLYRGTAVSVSDIPPDIPGETLAYVGTDGRIFYVAENIGRQLNISTTVGADGGLRFTERGLSLREYLRGLSGDQRASVMALLKPLRAHEATHRLLERAGIRSLDIEMPGGMTRWFSQEELCRIVDNLGNERFRYTTDELAAIERSLQEVLGADFSLEKATRHVRSLDTRSVAESARTGDVADFVRAFPEARSLGRVFD